MDLSSIRIDYRKRVLDEASVAPDVMIQLTRWIGEAQETGCLEYSAMSLATVSESGRPSVRIVLLKYIEDDSLYFFSNYESRKGREMLKNQQVALMFFWPELERQVRLEGTVCLSESALSDTYFQERPIESRISAMVSKQSTEIPNREFLEKLWFEESEKWKAKETVRPEYWGGYRFTPDTIEFWQGRPNRLHDRILYRQCSTGWDIVRLAP